METRIAVIGIIVENRESVEAVNTILHQYGQYIIGRMGLPYEKKKMNIISIVVDAPQDAISALSGKLGNQFLLVAVESAVLRLDGHVRI